MTRKEKLLKKFLRNPESLRFGEIETLLFNFGYGLVRVKGSHHHYEHDLLEEKLIIAVHNNDCLKIYKKFIVKLFINNFLSV